MNIISKIEDEHLFNLYGYVKYIFREKNLPSHDESHHIRVWLHCRGLLIELTRIGFNFSYQFVENTLIACMFHDTGLVDVIGEKHGERGAQICCEYLNKINFVDKNRISRIAEAIELHDDKGLKSSLSQSPEDMVNLNRIVSTADDLDSIGYIGVFRYIEIYLKRGMMKEELPLKVVKNLKNRVANFLTSYSYLIGYCKRQKLRAAITMDFFTSLDSHMALGSSASGTPLEVYNIFANMVTDSTVPFDRIISDVLNSYTSGYTLQFFGRLQKELDVLSVIVPHEQ